MRHYLLLFSFFLLSCSSADDVKSKPPTQVKIIKTKKRKYPIYLHSKGFVEPKLTVHISSRVTGEITGVYFQEGDDVKAGELLFTIDPRNFQAKLKKNKGLLEEKISRLKLAQEKVERYRSLAQEQYYSQLDFDSLVQDVNRLLASIKQAEAQVDDATTNLSYCWIYSPIEGKAGILQVDEGNVVQGWEKETLVTIHQMKPIYISFSLPENNLPILRKKIKESKIPVKVTTSSFEEESFEGSLEMINNEITHGEVTLKASFANKKEELWPHQSVDVRVLLQTKENVIAIPKCAIMDSPSKHFVYVVDKNNKISRREVEQGATSGSTIEIVKGLEEDEEIVIEKQKMIREGDLVQVIL